MKTKRCKDNFNVSDIGQHYLKLLEAGTTDEDMGVLLRRFIIEFCPEIKIKGTAAYGVENPNLIEEMK